MIRVLRCVSVDYCHVVWCLLLLHICSFRTPNCFRMQVSLVRAGMAHFGLSHYAAAITSFRKALELTGKENATRAKILNNLGVAHYQMKDFPEALKAFAGALEIQRIWLEGPVRREAIVFDASITLCNMGKVMLEQEDYESAFYVYEEALLVSIFPDYLVCTPLCTFTWYILTDFFFFWIQLQTTAFRKNSSIVMDTLSNLAYAKAMSGDTKKSISVRLTFLQSWLPCSTSRTHTPISHFIGYFRFTKAFVGPRKRN